MTEKDVIDAFVEIRRTNNTVPDKVLNFMKYAAIEKLNANSRYKTKIDGFSEIYTLEEWKLLKETFFSTFAKSAYWAKDGFESNDEAFETPQLDATHVVCYKNKKK